MNLRIGMPVWVRTGYSHRNDNWKPAVIVGRLNPRNYSLTVTFVGDDIDHCYMRLHFREAALEETYLVGLDRLELRLPDEFHRPTFSGKTVPWESLAPPEYLAIQITDSRGNTTMTMMPIPPQKKSRINVEYSEGHYMKPPYTFALITGPGTLLPDGSYFL